MKINKEEYQSEQDKLLTTILTYRFFNPWKNIGEYSDERSLINDSHLELYITNNCNQKCEYCYLHKYPELYPKEYNKPEIILHNLELLYQYFITNKYFIPTIDMFTGEIWHTQLGLDILKLTEKYIYLGLNFNKIIIPTNGFFTSDPVMLQKIQSYIDKFNSMNRRIAFSFSIDGALIDNDGRPRNNSNIYTDEFYDNLFAFAKHNTFYFHPMISAHNIHLWHDNYLWWKQQFKKYNMNVNNIMLLEVRNDEWTKEAIDTYCKFIIELLEDTLKNTFNNDIKQLGDFLINKPTSKIFNISGYFPWLLTGIMDNFIGCTIANHLTVRLGDLAICPCHRTSYDKYNYGYFKIENDMITGIIANNPHMAIKILMGNTLTSMHKCDTCIYKTLCLKGCIGAQIEYTGDPFFPCPSVCALFEKKYSTLLEYYARIGLFNYFKTFLPEQEGADEAIGILQTYEQWRKIHNELGKER